MPISDMIARALTLPTPGSDSSSDDDLELADRLVRLPLLDHLGERALRVLQPILHLGASLPRGGGLLQRCGALFGSQRRKSHARHLLVSGRATHVVAGPCPEPSEHHPRSATRTGSQHTRPARSRRERLSAGRGRLARGALRPPGAGPRQPGRHAARRATTRRAPDRRAGRRPPSSAAPAPCAPTPGASSGPLTAVRSEPVRRCGVADGRAHHEPHRAQWARRVRR